MCMLCIEIAKGYMTKQEISRALKELNQEDPHVKEIADKNEIIQEPELIIVKDYFPVHDEFNNFGEFGDE